MTTPVPDLTPSFLRLYLAAAWQPDRTAGCLGWLRRCGRAEEAEKRAVEAYQKPTVW